VVTLNKETRAVSRKEPQSTYSCKRSPDVSSLVFDNLWATAAKMWLKRPVRLDNERCRKALCPPPAAVAASLSACTVTIQITVSQARQSIQCLTTGWTTGVRSRIFPPEDFSASLCVQTGSGAHPVSCAMGTRGPFPRGKARPGRDADHSPPLVPSLRKRRSYTSSPPSAIHGVWWDHFTFN
jgi:hypothetical protein